MTRTRLRRSALFMPASNERALEKARDLAADVLIFDLEDAVAPGMKADARALAAEAVRTRAFGEREVVVRINAPDSPEGLADLEAILPAAPDAILAPKIESAEGVERLSALFDQAEAPRGLAIWAMVETPRALLNIADIAGLGARRRLAALIVGLNDMAAEMHAEFGADRAYALPILTQVVAAARAYGLAAIDAVFNDHRDITGFRPEARQARALGFDGKSLIHPGQIEPCHDAFKPSTVELDWARRVVEAFHDPVNLERGAISVDGRMVERLHYDQAQRTLAMADEG